MKRQEYLEQEGHHIREDGRDNGDAEFEEEEILNERLRLEAEDEVYRKAMKDEYYAEMQRQEEEWRISQTSY